MHFDWTINAGNVLTAVVLLVGLVKAHTQNIKRLQEIEFKLSLLYSWFTKKIEGIE